jgi:hypothetical protein
MPRRRQTRNNNPTIQTVRISVCYSSGVNQQARPAGYIISDSIRASTISAARRRTSPSIPSLGSWRRYLPNRRRKHTSSVSASPLKWNKKHISSAYHVRSEYQLNGTGLGAASRAVKSPPPRFPPPPMKKKGVGGGMGETRAVRAKMRDLGP